MSVIVLPLKSYYGKLCHILLNYGVILGQVVSNFVAFSSHSVELCCHSCEFQCVVCVLFGKFRYVMSK